MNVQDKNELRVQVAKELRLAGPEKVDLQVLPAMEVHMRPVTRERKGELAASIDAEFGARIDKTKVMKTPTPLDDASLLAVCKTCQGSCCKSGETHAYLTRAVLKRVRKELKFTSDAALLEAYLDRVPELSVEGSCIYHGARGCALSREMRSETCNRFLCYPLKQLGRDFGRPGYAQVAVSASALSAEQEARVLLLSEGEARELRPYVAKRESV